MKKTRSISVLVLLFTCLAGLFAGNVYADPNESTKYLDAVREFADNVLKYGRDTYGPKHTPLFIDGLNAVLYATFWNFLACPKQVYLGDYITTTTENLLVFLGLK